MNYTVKNTDSFPVSIFIAGDLQQATIVAGEYCDKIGLCVTVTPTDYVYTAKPGTKGWESGIIVGLINYPRFPAFKADIIQKAEDLGKLLLERLGQQSFTIQTPHRTMWYSTRPEDQEGA